MNAFICLQAHRETRNVIMKVMPVGLLIGLEGIRHDSLPLEVLDAAVVTDKEIILHEPRDVPTACTWSAPVT